MQEGGKTLRQKKRPSSPCSKRTCLRQSDTAELDRLVTEVITETGATTPKDMGRVMKAVMAKVAGRTVDGKVLSELVKRKLAVV